MRCAILPPHVLEAMRAHPDVRVRDSARRALIVGRKLRERPAPLRPAEAAGRVGGPHPLVRRIFSCAWSATVPGVLMRAEGQPPCQDAETNRAFDAAGAVHAFWREVFERDSIDGRGMHLISSVHYRDYDNAFWDAVHMTLRKSSQPSAYIGGLVDEYREDIA